MSISLCRLWIGIALSFPCCAQATKPGLKARDVYFESVDAEKFSASNAARTKADAPAPDLYIGHTRLEANGLRPLGIRYKLLLSNGTSEPPQKVLPKRIFKTGDHVALELHANRSGYLYIISEGASGTWRSLGPPTLIPDESTETAFGSKPPRAPAHGWFVLADPPGDERLFLFLSGDLADAGELVKLFELSSLARPGRTSDPTLAGRETIASLRYNLRGRDVTFTEVEEPGPLDPDPYTVYAVAPGPRVSVEVVLTHR